MSLLYIQICTAASIRREIARVMRQVHPPEIKSCRTILRVPARDHTPSLRRIVIMGHQLVNAD